MRERHISAVRLTGRVQGAQQERTTTASAAKPALTPRGRTGAAVTPAAPATSSGLAAGAQYAAMRGRTACARVPARTPWVALIASAGASAHARATRNRTRSDDVRERVGTHAIIAAMGHEATSRKVATAPGVTPVGAAGALSSDMRVVRGSAPPTWPSPPGIHPAHAALHSSDQSAGSAAHAPPTRPAEAPHHWKAAISEVTTRRPRAAEEERMR